MTSSSKEARKANSAAETMPGAASGIVTVSRVRTGPLPRLSAARSRCGSTPCKVESRISSNHRQGDHRVAQPDPGQVADQAQPHRDGIERDGRDDGRRDNRQQAEGEHELLAGEASAHQRVGQQEADAGCDDAGDQADLDAGPERVPPLRAAEEGREPAQPVAGRWEAQKVAAAECQHDDDADRQDQQQAQQRDDRRQDAPHARRRPACAAGPSPGHTPHTAPAWAASSTTDITAAVCQSSRISIERSTSIATITLPGPAHQGRRDEEADAEDEHDQAAGYHAMPAQRQVNPAEHGERPGAQRAGGAGQAGVDGLDGGIQRQDHIRQQDVGHADHDGEAVVEQRQGLRDQPAFEQELVDDAVAPRAAPSRNRCGR